MSQTHDNLFQDNIHAPTQRTENEKKNPMGKQRHLSLTIVKPKPQVFSVILITTTFQEITTFREAT